MTPLDNFSVRSPSEAARRVAALVPAPQNDLAALKSVVTELCLNVLHWAEAAGNVFAERDRHQVIITVQDDGVGIPDTMRRAFPDLKDHEAVERALTAGVSSSGELWRGYGLADAVRLSARDGFSVYVESRGVAAWAVDGTPTFSSKSGGAIAGTRVQIIYSCVDR